jgi:uncharacterized protein with transglutaminase domain
MNRQSQPPPWRTLASLALIAIPLLMAAPKVWQGAPWAAIPTSLEPLTAHARRHVEYLMLVPLGTMLVAVFRLGLGIRVLSIFRPVLLAIAFRRTGIPLGLALLTLALASVVALQPALKGRGYYERVSVIAVMVVAMMAASLIAFHHFQAGWMMHVAYFPVIALCLTCESFAKALRKSRLSDALWRAITTTAIGILIMAIARIPGLMPLLVRFPELLLAQAGCVLLVAERFQYRLFESFNPLAARPGMTAARVPLVETNQ